MATHLHTSVAALKRGTNALRRCAVTQGRLLQLRQVDAALEAGNAGRAKAIMSRIDLDLRLERGELIAPTPRSDVLISVAVAGAVAAGTIAITLVSCGAGVVS